MFCASSKAVAVAGVTETDGPGGMKSSVSHEVGGREGGREGGGRKEGRVEGGREEGGRKGGGEGGREKWGRGYVSPAPILPHEYSHFRAQPKQTILSQNTTSHHSIH